MPFQSLYAEAASRKRWSNKDIEAVDVEQKIP